MVKVKHYIKTLSSLPYMTTKILITTALVFVFACDSPRIQQKPQKETPKALEDQSSYEIIPKRGGEDLVENLYNELVSKDLKLKELEVRIDELNSSRHDSTVSFGNFNGKMQSYFRSADRHVSEISDSLLRDKIKLLIAGNLTKYNARVAGHNELLQTIERKNVKLSDLHGVLKIVRTLPVIEKYQKDNLPGIKSLEGFIKQQDQAVSLADTLCK